MRPLYFVPIILFFPILLIQLTVVQYLSIGGYVPDLILILLVFYALVGGQLYGTILGFVLGFFFDLLTGGVIGVAMLTKTFAGFIAGYFSGEGKAENYIKSYIFALIVLLCGFFDSIIYSLFTNIDFNFQLVKLIFMQGLIPALYTAVVSLLVVFFYPKRSFNW